MTDIWAYLLTGQGVVGIGEFEILRALLAEQAKAAAAADEPPLPVSRERFLTQPFRAR